jgi:hypothetical protein
VPGDLATPRGIVLAHEQATPLGDPPSAVRCTVLMTMLKVGLATMGFARTVGWIRRRTEPCMRRAGPATAIAPVAHAVALAGALYPGRALCLEQSLTLYYLLRRRGIDARLRLGVQPHPFGAHAWVEYAGAPVNDFPEHIKHFVALPEVEL